MSCFWRNFSSLGKKFHHLRHLFVILDFYNSWTRCCDIVTPPKNKVSFKILIALLNVTIDVSTNKNRLNLAHALACIGVACKETVPYITISAINTHENNLLKIKHEQFETVSYFPIKPRIFREMVIRWENWYEFHMLEIIQNEQLLVSLWQK